MRTISASFLRAWRYTMNFEVGGKPDGGYTNDPNDPGGETKWGIAKRYHPKVDIKNLTETAAQLIAYDEVWRPLFLDQLIYNAIATEIFDTAFNTGNATAVRIAQGSLILLGQDVKLDGVMGPKTVSAINGYKYPDSLLHALNGFQFMVYVLGAGNADEVIEMIKGRKDHIRRYLRGWMKRLKVEQI